MKKDPNELIVDENGTVISYQGDDAEFYTRAVALAEAMVAWKDNNVLLEPGIDAAEMLILTEELTGIKYETSEFAKATDHVSIWCVVMRSALPEIVKATH